MADAWVLAASALIATGPAAPITLPPDTLVALLEADAIEVVEYTAPAELAVTFDDCAVRFPLEPGPWLTPDGQCLLVEVEWDGRLWRLMRRTSDCKIVPRWWPSASPSYCGGS